ncbi:transmembrane protease serine 5-like [Rhinoraja longicauda]
MQVQDLKLVSSGTSWAVRPEQADGPLLELKTKALTAQSSADHTQASESTPMDPNDDYSHSVKPTETEGLELSTLEGTGSEAPVDVYLENTSLGSESILLDSQDGSPHIVKPTEAPVVELHTIDETKVEAPPEISSGNITPGSESILLDSKDDDPHSIKPAETNEVVPLLEATTPTASGAAAPMSVRRRRWRRRFRPRRRPPRATKRILALLCAVTILSFIVVGIYFIVRHLERPIEKKNLIPTGGNHPTMDCNTTEQNSSSSHPLTVSFRINSVNSLLEIHNQSWQGWLPACDTKWNSSLGKQMCRYMGHIEYLNWSVINVSEIESNYTQGFAEITDELDSDLENIWSHRTSCKSGSVIALKCSVCGEKHDFSMIVGGHEAAKGSWPWQATLYQNYKHTCGASILNQYWLITAAHCVYRSPLARYWRVYVGILDREVILFTGHPTFAVEKIIYSNSYNHETHDYDIALMKLTRPITFSNMVRAICLPRFNQQIVPGRKCWISGWGFASADAYDTENILKEASVPLISTERCNSSCMYNGALTPRMLCAGYREGKVDACQGDSGGPLVCEGMNAWHLIGVISWGLGCAEANHPGVYTKVSEFREWIYSVIEG